MADIPWQINTGATRIALMIARTLTDTRDDRIPDELPSDLDDLQQTIAALEDAAADYAERAHHACGDTSVRHTAWSMLIHIHAAGDIARAVIAYGQTVTADPGPVHVTAEAVLLSTITWQLADHKTRETLTHLGIGCAAYVASQFTANSWNGDDGVDAEKRIAQAGAELLARSGTSDMTVKVVQEIAHDAYDLGVSMLSLGRTREARKALTFARLHGIRRAATLIPDIAARWPYDPAEPLDFTSNPEMWRHRADVANRIAHFVPAAGMESTTDPDPQGASSPPCIEVAGAQAYLYLDGRTGRITVYLNLVSTESWLATHEADVPVEVPIEVSVDDRLRLVSENSRTQLYVDDVLVHEQT